MAKHGVQPNKVRATTPETISLTINDRSQQLVKEQLISDYGGFAMADFRIRFELLDLAYYMENSEHLRNTNASRIITTIYKELELPVLQPNIDAAHAFLVGIFLANRPMFPVVSETKEQTPVAKQIEAIVGENSAQTGWPRQLNLTLKNALKYNVGAASVEWVTRNAFKFITNTNVSFTEATIEDTLRAGNEIVNQDMYNTFYDMTVPAADVYQRGDFAGSVDRLTLAQLHTYIADLESNSGIVLNVDQSLWQSAPMHNWYYEPNILNESTIQSSTNWDNFFFRSPAGHGPMNRVNLATFERVIYYRKIIPEMFEIKIADASKVQLWKFVEVNGIIIYAERKTTAHQLLPMIFFQPNEDNLRHQSKGLGATLLPYQNLSSTMFRARIASLARALSDRAIYDPTMVSEKDINSVVPTAKIPLRPNQYGKSIGDAYHPIPYDDRNSRDLYNDIAAVNNMASDAAHLNSAQRGQFTKGNRTAEEFNEIMLNANATQQASALLLEYQAFTPLKYQIKVNILQYQNSTEIADPNTNELVSIDPVELRAAIVNFRLADGLVTRDELIGTAETIQAFQVFQGDAQANLEYDLVGMMGEVLGQPNSRLIKWKRSEQEKAQIIERQQQQQSEVVKSNVQQ